MSSSSEKEAGGTNDVEFLPTEGTVRIGECLRGQNGTETYLASEVGLV